jgi:hypothetical protein
MTYRLSPSREAKDRSTSFDIVDEGGVSVVTLVYSDWNGALRARALLEDAISKAILIKPPV